MNQDREMILKMLKDGKVTVEEAEALLQVLEESHEETTERSEGGRPKDDGTIYVHKRKRRTADEEDSESEGFSFQFDKDFDFSFIGETVKKSLAGLKDTIRGAMEGIKDVDVEAEIKRAFGKEKGYAETELTIPVDGALVLELGASSGQTGDVEVERSDDDLIHVHGSVTAWANEQEAAEERASSARVAAVREGDTIAVSADTPEPEGLRRVRVDYRILLPAGLVLRLDTMSGDLSVEGVTGACSLSTISGDISAEDIGGSLQASTKSGSIEIEDVDGDVTARSLSGDITIGLVGGRVESDTKSGDVSISGAGPDVNARSLSGDVAVQITRTADAGDVELRSISGDVELALPDAQSFQLEATTTSGSIDCDRPLENEARNRTSLRGSYGAAGARIAMSTVSGDIELE